MKYLFAFILIYMPLIVSSQKDYTYKAVYELTYKADSTAGYQNTRLVLLMNDNQDSYFQDYETYKRDSVNSSQLTGTGAFIKDVVITDYSDRKIHISQTFENTKVYYTETIPQKWQIKPTEKLIGTIQCKEATLDAYGRKWNACFAEDYPFQFGPYFFAGLPGLIVSVEDEQKFYQFKLVSFRKENHTVAVSGKGIEVPKEKYYQMIYDADFSGNFFNKFKMQDADEQERLKRKFIEGKKKLNTFPVDQSMRYVFEK
ncbi:GLPGLI family protein [Chryseobacterium sp. MFBS3-17]|uniref:GLPGLI family protein n=1 Tax=Chryseobacterium sp. MFBS3-17 TaxID=2886689 RepID=UPI001D0E5A4F|nr:GLPGLI family protein [Chryseobacterium sp. MFBS3-17]MCC2589481.1 GLPGLI family protein [Chryseobacterium sp. MFBS3-17]